MDEERARVRSDWPKPAVVAEPEIRADEHDFFLRYRTSDSKTVIVHFQMCRYLIFGAPNDEALGGHPLARRGLEFYSVHDVEHSSLIAMLERRNSVHPSHSKSSFLQDKKHYIFTFQDSTLECVVTEGRWGKPKISVFDTADAADLAWRAIKESE